MQNTQMALYSEACRRGVQYTMIGEPSLPILPVFLEGIDKYVTEQKKAATAAWDMIGANNIDGAARFKTPEGMRAAEGYTDPQGNFELRQRVAKTLNKLYHLPPEHAYSADEILFTAGATGSLSALTQHINKDQWVLASKPHHTWHMSPKMVTFDVSDGALSPKRAAEALLKARRDGKDVQEIILCEPHNPMGFSTPQETWKEFAEILRRPENKHLKVTIDEAYAEVAFDGHSSLLEAAPDLKDRLTIIRTIGKGFSATGYRIGITAASRERVQDIMSPNIDTYFKVAPALQAGYTDLLEWYAEHKMEYQEKMKQFYGSQVDMVRERTKSMGVAYAGQKYDPKIFYALMDLSEMKGLPLTPESKNLLGDANTSGVIETDVDIAAYLLTEKNICLYPTSFYANDPQKCLIRVTCGQGPTEMTRVMDQLEAALQFAREPEQKRVNAAYLRNSAKRGICD